MCRQTDTVAEDFCMPLHGVELLMLFCLCVTFDLMFRVDCCHAVNTFLITNAQCIQPATLYDQLYVYTVLYNIKAI